MRYLGTLKLGSGDSCIEKQDLLRPFGHLLRRYRLASGLTQVALADLAGLGRRGIQDLERGLHYPRRETVSRLVRGLRLTGDQRTKFEAESRPHRRPTVPTASVHVVASGDSGGEVSNDARIPEPLTKLVGRDSHLNAIKSALQESRLVTLTGSGGCGKTRLALQLAHDVAENDAGGVAFVELATISDPDLLAQTVASSLRLSGEPRLSVTTVLVRYLARRQFLLILDNCEHLIDPCAQLIGQLLKGCPKLTVMATSRQALSIVGEVRWRVPSLTVFDPAFVDLADPKVLSKALKYSGVQLFIERARSVLPRFRLDRENVASVAQICWRLDGIPLAIELAAALVSGLATVQIAQRLDDRFRILSFGNRGALPRQQTLFATLDWSYSLLTDDERVLFRRLGVFSGSFSLDAVEEICGAIPSTRANVTSLLFTLVDKSLVEVQSKRGECRYHLLETIRQYARERSRGAKEFDGVADRFREWYLHFLGRIGPGLYDENQIAWLEQLEDERHNLRDSLAWFREHDATAGLRMAAGLWRFWLDRGYHREADDWLTSLLSISSERTPLRGRALFGLGYIRSFHGLKVAEPVLLECFDVFQECGDRPGQGAALYALGVAARHSGEYAQARELFERSLTILLECQEISDASDRSCIGASWAFLGRLDQIDGDHNRALAHFEAALKAFRPFNDLRDIAFTHHQLAISYHHQGDLAQAWQNIESSLQLSRQTGHNGNLADTLVTAANLAREQHDYGRAKSFLDQSLAFSRAKGNQLLTNVALLSRGRLALAQGHLDETETLLVECLSGSGEYRSRSLTAKCLEACGVVAGQRGFLDRSVCLAGAACAVDPLFQRSLDRMDREDYDRGLLAAEAQLGRARYADAWRRGQEMSIDRAIVYALSTPSHSGAIAVGVVRPSHFQRSAPD